MKKYVIVQNTIMHYRVPLYEIMSSDNRISLTVIHIDNKLNNKEFKFNAKCLPSIEVGGLYIQPGLISELKNADVILCMFNLKWLSILRCLMTPEIGRKTFLWTHGYGRFKYLDKIRIFFVKKCRGLVLYYKEFDELYINHGIPRSKIFESSNTVSVPNHEYNGSVRKKSFIFVGRLQERKDIRSLLIAFKSVAKNNQNVQLNIFGTGPCERDLREEAEQLKLSHNTFFHGKCTDSQKLKKYFQEAYGYVSPGHVGLGILHAFAYGCPVVTNLSAYHAPEHVNLIDGVNSILYTGGISNLTSVMNKLVNDEQLSKELGKKAYELYVSARTIDIMAENLVSLINFEEDTKSISSENF